ncbi:MAG TPA: PLDc N-terminal domain-containing protein [Trebonia sp.]|jgi:hypothetical protein|nr:PLDc N-terminal domain-containing protein [Trebonia sp.]
MSQVPRVQRIAELVIRGSCRRLPEDQRAERGREWSAELPAILSDTSVRPAFRRGLRALGYTAGIAVSTGRLRRAAAGAGNRSGGAVHARPASAAFRAARGLAIWLAIAGAFVGVLSAIPHPGAWPIAIGLALAVPFAAYCLADIARAESVRGLPKWAWAIICVIQVPGGGIAYLTFGRVGRADARPPGSVPRR